LRIFGRDTASDLCIVSEIGVNHGGDVSWIINLLPQLKDAGVDAVKLQVFTPEKYVAKSNQERYAFLATRALSQKAYLEIQHEACEVVKVASGDFLFKPIVVPLLESNVKLIFSTGAVSAKELSLFLTMAREIREGENLVNSVALLHCVSSYPPPLLESNLRAISHLSRLSGLEIGFSNHFISDSPIFCALALGARIFEIHVTDDRSRNDIRDHQLSRTPKEIKILNSELRDLLRSLQTPNKQVQASEMPNIPLMRKGIVTKCEIAAGDRFSKENIAYARPETDLKADDYEWILDKTASVAIPANTSLRLMHIERS
jgi:sialic acid synthase SpsE